FEEGIKFEPLYDSFYRNQAVYMKPQWNGEEGDSAKIGELAVNRVGGEDGDILYFQVATEISCACSSTDFSYMSFPRVKKGYEAVGRKYGQSMAEVNAYALMAIDANEIELADALFKQIGDHWSKDVWTDEEYF